MNSIAQDNGIMNFETYAMITSGAVRHFGGTPTQALKAAIENEMIGHLRGEADNGYETVSEALEICEAGTKLKENGMAHASGREIFDAVIMGMQRDYDETIADFMAGTR